MYAMGRRGVFRAWILAVGLSCLWLGVSGEDGGPALAAESSPGGGGLKWAPDPFPVSLTQVDWTLDFGYGGTGDGSASAPFSWIWDALDAAQPGDTIQVMGDGAITRCQESPRITKALRMHAYNGVVRIGGDGVGATRTLTLPGGVALEMAWVPDGSYYMGRYSGEVDSDTNEDPRHLVTLPGFWMAKYEVTKRQWQALMGTTPWEGKSFVLADLDSPAVFVSWDDAQAFVAALNAHAGTSCRLPSESEWEYACRAGRNARFYWGDDPNYTEGDEYAWWTYNAYDLGEAYAHVVGLKTANAWGLHDMVGNVWEYCQDTYQSDYTGAPTDGGAWELPEASSRVARGGAWSRDGAYCRSANRNFNLPSYKGSTTGIRIAE